MASIILNGVEVELPNDTTLAVTLAANNLHDPTTRNGIYSNTFKMPRTAQMKSIIENADKTNANTTIPYTRMEAIIMDGGGMFQKGTAILREVNDSYDLFFIASNSDWLSQLGNKLISDIDISELDMPLTLANVSGYRDNLWNNGIIYPNINYGNLTPRDNGELSYKEFRHAIFIKYLLESLLTGLGYTISGLWWFDTDENFDSCVLPFSNQNFVIPDYLTINRVQGTIDSDRSFAIPAAASFYTITNSDLVFDSDIDPALQFDLLGILIQTSGYYNLSATFTIGISSGVVVGGDSGVDTDLKIKVNGTMVYYVNDFALKMGDPDVDLNIINKFTYLYAGDLVTFEVVAGVNVQTNVGTYYIRANSAISCVPTYNVYGDTPISMAANLPKITQKDFIRFISNRFGLIFMTDNFAKDIRIEKLDYILSKKLQAKDWSDKLDLSITPKRTFQFKDYAQVNNLKWKEDKNDDLLEADPTYGNYYINVGNVNIATEKDLYISCFAATKIKTAFTNLFPLAGANVNKDLASIPIFKLKDNTSVYFYDATTTYTNSNITIVVYRYGGYFRLRPNETQAAGAFDYTKWDYVYMSEIFDSKQPVPRVGYIAVDGGNNITYDGVSEGTQPQLYFEDLTFDKAILNSYNTLSGILVDVRVVEALFHLSKVDIVNYMETKTETDGALIPIWLIDENGEGNYYYINEIKQYKFNSSESCWVELIRL